MATEEKIERTFETGEQCELTVENVQGEIEVSGWDRPEVQVTAVKRGNGDIQVDIGADGPRVWVRTKKEPSGRWLSWLRTDKGMAEVNYDIKVPRTSQISLKGVNGAIGVTDITGTVYAKAVNGATRLRGISGSTIVKAVNGGLEADDLSGKAGFTTVSGGIAIRRSQLSSLSAKTVSGSVTVETSLDPQGSYQARTVSGGFELVIPADSRCTITAKSASGGVDCELPCEVKESGRGRWRADVGGGGVKIGFNSVSGGVRIVASDALSTEPVAVSEPSAPTEVPEESPEMAILRAIEQGELSVDEALARLEQLEEDE